MPAPSTRSRLGAGWRIALGLLTVMVLVAAGFVCVGAWSLSRVLSQVEQIPHAFPAAEADRPPALTGEAAKAQNILVLGSDTRGPTVQGTLADMSGQHSDTIMVVHVPADRRNLYVMSILRDSSLTVPGHGTAKISDALSWGGVPLAVQTVEGLLDVRMDHVAVVDFGGFEGVTDALGGVDIHNPVDFMASHLAGHHFAKGNLHLNGQEALAFGRERDAYRDDDFQRVRNQQLLIKALFGRLGQGRVLLNPGKVGNVLDALAPHLAVDEGLDLAYLASSGWKLRDIRSGNITFFTMPAKGTGAKGHGKAIVDVDWDKLPGVKTAFQTDTLGSYRPEVQTVG